jgi:hypothetical protein
MGAAAVTAMVCTLSAQRPEPAVDAIKAAFLYNFTKYVDWPPHAFEKPESAFNVCVFADAGFHLQLKDTLMNELVRGRQVTITTYADGDDLRACHLVYFDARHLDRSAARLPALKQAPILTVGEGARFLQQGGMIAFFVEGDRVRFDISRRGAEAAGLGVSSKLLRVARQIHGAPAP